MSCTSTSADLIRRIVHRELVALDEKAHLDDEDVRRFEALTRTLRHANEIAEALEDVAPQDIDIADVIRLAERRG